MASSTQLSPPCLNVVVNQIGYVIYDFSTMAPPIGQDLNEFIDSENKDLFETALKTTELLKNIRINFLLNPPGCYITTFTPGRLSGTIHILAHPIPEGEDPIVKHNEDKLHELKGAVRAFEVIVRPQAVRAAQRVSPSSVGIGDLRKEAEETIRTMGGTLSPFRSRRESPSERTLINIAEFMGILHTSFALQSDFEGKQLLPLVIPDSIPLSLIGNFSALDMILKNLLSNAIKYSNEGGLIQFSIELLEDPAGSPQVKLRFLVTNTGEPLLAELRERVFTRGDRLEHAEGGIEGQGIGLSAAKEEATSHGWNLDFSPSEDPVGTTFFLDTTFNTLTPLPEEPSSPRTLPPLTFYDIGVQEKRRENINIVLIEDESLSLRLATHLLTRILGIAIANLTVATDFAHARTLCQLPTTDLLIIDNNLWGQSGFSLARIRRAWETAKEARRIPCVFVSATEIPPEECHSNGGTTALMKALTPAALDGILSEYFVDPAE